MKTTLAPDLVTYRFIPNTDYSFSATLLEKKDQDGNLLPGSLDSVLKFFYHDGGRRTGLKIFIKVDPRIEWNGSLPYSFQFIPAPIGTIAKASQRGNKSAQVRSSIIRIIAAPGVSINAKTYSNRLETHILDIPHTEVLRVQDSNLIPPLGRDILTYNYLHSSYHDPSDPYQDSTYKILPENHVRIERLHYGIDVVQSKSKERVSIRVGPVSPEDAFAYKFIKQGLQVTLLIFATKSVDIKGDIPLQPFFGARPFQNQSFSTLDRMLVSSLRVENIAKFNKYKGAFLNDKIPAHSFGKDVVYAPVGGRVVSTAEEEIALAMLDTMIGFMPVIGDLYDIAQFFYALKTGKNPHGKKVSTLEVVVMGACALLPFITTGMIRGAKSIHKVFGPKAERAGELASEIKLNGEARKLITEANVFVKQGERIPLSLQTKILKEINLPKPNKMNLDDLLNADKSGFTDPALQKKYETYLLNIAKKNKNKKPGDPDKLALNPEKWTKMTRGSARELLEKLLGKDFAKNASKITGGKYTSINATEVIRPSSLDDIKLKDFIKQLLEDEAKLFERIPSSRLVNGKVPKNLFGTLKGNIGEILAKVEKDEILALRKIELKDPDLKMFENVTIQIKNSEGKWSSPKLFSDGIVGKVDKYGNFRLSDLIEIKAGGSSAQKVQGQIFDWIEDKIQDGAKLHIAGKIFEYPATEKLRKGAVVGLANGKRHIITPQGKSHLGMKSADQIAPAVGRSELPADSGEIDFLTSLISNISTVNLAKSHSEIDFAVAELIRGIS